MRQLLGQSVPTIQATWAVSSEGALFASDSVPANESSIVYETILFIGRIRIHGILALGVEREDTPSGGVNSPLNSLRFLETSWEKLPSADSSIQTRMRSGCDVRCMCFDRLARVRCASPHWKSILVLDCSRFYHSFRMLLALSSIFYHILFRYPIPLCTCREDARIARGMKVGVMGDGYSYID